MTSRLETIFSEAIELPEVERASYLDETCGSDLHLRQEVESLLRHSESLATIMLRRSAGLTLLTTSAEVLPISLERYELQSRIGEGAFGVVYRARQHTPVRRQVAIKVLRPGLDSAEIVRRFEAERQALAALDHANIARFFDAGNMPDGRPYFVMEFLEGLSLTAYCDTNRLGIRERLQLFIEVCAGVEHAHRRGILHRDLKPSNILIVQSEDRPNVKVIDFGIARAVGAELPFGTLATEAGRLLGTPEYMSPEQIDGEPHDVDTRSDVYALGVVLYELLCGRLPFDSKKLRALRVSELRRIVCEVMPPPPSCAWDDNESGLADSAQFRDVAPMALVASLKREIEWVPMRALRKSPADRYGSVSELTEDVRNYLAGNPLLAGPDTVAYRARKFVQRYRVAVTAISAILLLLVAGIFGTSIGMLNARRQRAAADENRQRAEVQLADTLIARGQYATDQSHFIDAWDAFVRAREIDLRMGKPTLSADMGMLGVLVAADPPIAILQSAQQGRPFLAYADGGRTLISSGVTSAIEWDVNSRRRIREFPFQILGISPDESVLYTQDQSHRPEARDRRTLAVINRLEWTAGDALAHMRVSPDGRWVIGFHTYRYFSVWNAKTGARIGRYQLDESGAVGAAFTADGNHAILASGAFGVEWDLVNAKEVKHFHISTPGLTDVDISPDQSRVAWGLWNRIPTITDASTERIVQTFDAHAMEVNRVAFTPDGKCLVSLGADTAVRMWDLSTGKLRRAMFGHRQPAWAIAFAPGGRYFATASVDGEIRVWDMDAQRPDFEIPHFVKGDALGLAFSRDDRILVRASDANIDVWDLDQRKQVALLHPPPVNAILAEPALLPDNAHVLAMQLESPGSVFEWDLQDGSAPRKLVSHGASTRGFFQSTDGKQIFTFDDGLGLRAWDAEHNKVLWERRTSRTEWHFYTVSPDAQFIGKLSDDGSVEVIRCADGSTVRKFNTVPTPSGFAQVQFVPGRSDLLVWAHYFDTRPHLMNFVTGEQIWVTGTQQHQRSGWQITPDGKMVAVGNGERQLDFLDMSDGRILFTAFVPSAIARWNFSPRMTRLSLYGADGRVWIADLNFGPRLAESDQLRPTDGISDSSVTKRVGDHR